MKKIAATLLLLFPLLMALESSASTAELFLFEESGLFSEPTLTDSQANDSPEDETDYSDEAFVAQYDSLTIFLPGYVFRQYQQQKYTHHNNFTLSIRAPPAV